MQVVIEIPEDRFNSIKHFGIKQNEVYMLEKSLISGKLLQKGRWIEKEDFNGDTYYDCSECGESFCLMDGTPTDNLYNFCPNCGCRMESPDGR